MIDFVSEEELFQPHRRKWADDATKTAVWAVYKFIHVNTVAPLRDIQNEDSKVEKVGDVNFNRTKK